MPDSHRGLKFYTQGFIQPQIALVLLRVSRLFPGSVVQG